MTAERDCSRRGFTLVEVMLTVSMFALAMAVLVSAVHTGTNTWRRADASLVRSSRMRYALDEIIRDLERVYFEPEYEDPIFEGDAKSVTFLCVEDRPDRAVPGAVCRVTWELKGGSWVRTCESIVAGRIAASESRTILEGVGDVTIRYFDSSRWRDTWDEDKTKTPQLVEVRVMLSGAPQSVRWGTAFVTGGNGT